MNRITQEQCDTLLKASMAATVNAGRGLNVTLCHFANAAIQHYIDAQPVQTSQSRESDTQRMDWIAINGSFGVDSVTGEVGGNGQKQMAATRKNIDAAINAKGASNV